MITANQVSDGRSMAGNEGRVRTPRRSGKTVVDGKDPISIHLKDPSVTLKDLEKAGETELVDEAVKEF